MNLSAAQARNLRAHMTHVIVAGRLPYDADTLGRFLDYVLAIYRACPAAVEQWVRTLPESTFPPIPLPPSTHFLEN